MLHTKQRCPRFSVCLPPPAPPSLSSSLSTERCACPQPVCDTDVFLRRDAYPAGKHLEAEKSPSKSRRHGLFCTQGLLTKWDSSLCLSPCLHRSLHRGTGPQVLSGVSLLVLRFGVSSRFISVSCQDYINLLQDHVKKDNFDSLANFFTAFYSILLFQFVLCLNVYIYMCVYVYIIDTFSNIYFMLYKSNRAQF